MIRVVVYDKPRNGLFPYRVDGHWGPGGAPLIGISFDPLGEACRVLEALGVAPTTTVGFYGPNGPILTSTIGAQRRLAHNTQKALPSPRRGRRKALVVRGSGIPGDG